MKVHELAKELNLSNSELIGKLKSIGIEVKSHLSALTDEEYNKFRGATKSSKDMIEPKKNSDSKKVESIPHIIRRNVKVINTDNDKKVIEEITTNISGEIKKSHQTVKTEDRTVDNSYSREGLGVVTPRFNNSNTRGVSHNRSNNVVVTRNGKKVEDEVKQEVVKPIEKEDVENNNMNVVSVEKEKKEVEVIPETKVENNSNYEKKPYVNNNNNSERPYKNNYNNNNNNNTNGNSTYERRPYNNNYNNNNTNNANGNSTYERRPYNNNYNNNNTNNTNGNSTYERRPYNNNYNNNNTNNTNGNSLIIQTEIQHMKEDHIIIITIITTILIIQTEIQHMREDHITIMEQILIRIDHIEIIITILIMQMVVQHMREDHTIITVQITIQQEADHTITMVVGLEITDLITHR
ncbi:MAG: translation initiation factor [Clostridia bacterium]|nr:translation initiation factor [Clostridia bacterium]